jgi:hypothetical protein
MAWSSEAKVEFEVRHTGNGAGGWQKETPSAFISVIGIFYATATAWRRIRKRQYTCKRFPEPSE